MPHCFQNLIVNAALFFQSSAKAQLKGSFSYLQAKSTHFPTDMTLSGLCNGRITRNSQICGYKVTGNLLSHCPIVPPLPAGA